MDVSLVLLALLADTGIDPSPGVITSVLAATATGAVPLDWFCCAVLSAPSVVYPPVAPVKVADFVTNTIVMLCGLDCCAVG